MTLLELIQELAASDDRASDVHLAHHLAIYAAPKWQTNSAVVVLDEPADGSVPPAAQGKTFLTYVTDAKRIVRDRQRNFAVTAEELARSVLYFAVYDEAEPIPSLEAADSVLPLAV
jgi:hypothetical protein